MDTIETYKALPHPFDRYEASDLGNVRNKDTGRILSSKTAGADGYVRIGLKDGFPKVKIAYVHRLVALVHVPGDTTLTVNHKDLNKANNVATNLEWITLSANHKHLHALRPELAEARGFKRRKAVVSIGLVDGVRTEWSSTRAAAIALGHWNKASNICNAIQRGTTAYGSRWQFKENEPSAQ